MIIYYHVVVVLVWLNTVVKQESLIYLKYWNSLVFLCNAVARTNKNHKKNKK